MCVTRTARPSNFRVDPGSADCAEWKCSRVKSCCCHRSMTSWKRWLSSMLRRRIASHVRHVCGAPKGTCVCAGRLEIVNPHRIRQRRRLQRCGNKHRRDKRDRYRIRHRTGSRDPRFRRSHILTNPAQVCLPRKTRDRRETENPWTKAHQGRWTTARRISEKRLLS